MPDQEAAFMEWLDRAYCDGSAGDGAKFTKWNMEVAYRAGQEVERELSRSAMLRLKVDASNHAADAETIRHERDNYVAALTHIAKLDYTQADIASVEAIRTALKELRES